MKHYSSVDDYIADQPKPAAVLLKELRKIIRDTAPKAQEKISYNMPYYSLNGRLLYFMLHKEHIGFYPMKTAIKAFQKELAGYQTGPGTVRFPLDKPLPRTLIRNIVEYRVKENLAKDKIG